MTVDIAIVLVTLIVALVLFVTEKIRMDVTALLVLATLALTGVVDPREAISGFSNPAVITVWAMFILSEGLSKTGVASIIGQHVLRFTGQTESRMIFVIMLTAASLSAVMNNIGVAALMLPVVLSIARKTETSPSKLLMPLAYGSLLGGLTTLIGTPPNLLISDALKQNHFEPFGLFDYTPIGVTVMLGGIAFVALTSRLILPDRGKPISTAEGTNIRSLYSQYKLGERSFFLRIKPKSILAGRSLIESHLGRALGLRVIALERNGATEFAPNPNTLLQEGDRLMTQGQTERFRELQGWQELVPQTSSSSSAALLTPDVSIAEVTIADRSSLIGKSVEQADFRKQFGVTILLIRRDNDFQERDIALQVLKSGDRLLVQGKISIIAELEKDTSFSKFSLATPEDIERFGNIKDRLFEISIPKDSWLAGKAIKESQLRQGFDLHVLKIQRQDKEIVLPEPDEIFQPGDILTLHGEKEDLKFVRGLQELEIEIPKDEEQALLEFEEVSLAEATLSPKAKIVGQTPSSIRFSERYGLQLLAIQQTGRYYRSDLANRKLEFGDSFLLMGPQEKIALLEEDPDFILLSKVTSKTYRRSGSLLASGIMLAVLIPVFFGWYPISITAISGAALMVLSGCLKMEDAYRAIDWKSVFLIAGMLPMGTAIQTSGAADLLANGIMSFAGGYGPWFVIGCLYAITAIATTIIPTSALVVLMSPIVFRSCSELGIAPQTAMMAVALAASASFTSPISHPANILVMGPGGYRFADYIKVGAPLAFIVFVIAMLTLPIFWPLQS